MKKLITLSIVLLISTCIQAQFFNKKIKGNGHKIQTTRVTSDYEKITISGSFNIKLIKGTVGKLKIHIEENLMPYLITEVNKGTLNIHWKKNMHIKTRRSVLIEVPFKSLNAISMSGSGDVFSDETITTDYLKIALAGSGDIVLHINSKLTKATIAGSGNLKLKGTSTQLKCSVAGSGGFSGKSLKCQEVNVSVIGSGDASVFTTKSLKASLSGSGDITYYGKPTKEKIHVVGSGKVVMR